LAKAAAGQAGEAEDPLQRALAVIAARFSADRAFVLKVDADGQLGRVARSFGQGPIVVSRTVIRTVIEEQQAVAFGDAAGAFLLQGGVSLAAGEIRSLLAAPLLYDQRTFGVLHVDRKDRHAYTVTDLEAFAAASRLVALMLLATTGLEQKRRTKRRAPAPRPLGDSPVFQRLLKEAERAARTDSSVLLVGPTGSGKEVLARFLHEQSPRAEGPFVAINCGAIPEALAESELFGHEAGAFTGATTAKVGLFEAASGGTLFLDEVGATHKNTQTKLLRALQERVFQRLGSTTLRSVELRVIAASDRPLAHLVAEGLFRADLAFRLAVVTLEVPPLSARPGDVPLLAQSFVQTIAQEIGMGEKQLDPEVLARLEARAWPGNVRELRNTIERLVILSEGPRIGLGDLPTDLLAGLDQVDRAARSGQTLAEVLAEVEKAMILRAMARTGGVKVAAAEALGISRVTLDAKLKAYGRGPEKKFRDPSTAE
jgi:DNA-binding NtrC family response regulator